jgi:hypothetical protein
MQEPTPTHRFGLRGPWRPSRIGWAVFRAVFIGGFWAFYGIAVISAMRGGDEKDIAIMANPLMWIFLFCLPIALEALIEDFLRWIFGLFRRSSENLSQFWRSYQRKTQGQRIETIPPDRLSHQAPEQPRRRRISEEFS